MIYSVKASSVRIIADSVPDCKPFFGIIFPALALLLQFVIADNPSDFRQHGFRNGAHGIAQMVQDGGRVKVPDSVQVVRMDVVRGIQAATGQNRILDADSHDAPETRPDGLVALVPEGSIGNTWYGTTPEEADGVNTALVNTGVALTTMKIPHPVNTNIIASEIVLPSYERMDEVALLKVLA